MRREGARHGRSMPLHGRRSTWVGTRSTNKTTARIGVPRPASFLTGSSAPPTASTSAAARSPVAMTSLSSTAAIFSQGWIVSAVRGLALAGGELECCTAFEALSDLVWGVRTAAGSRQSRRRSRCPPWTGAAASCLHCGAASVVRHGRLQIARRILRSHIAACMHDATNPKFFFPLLYSVSWHHAKKGKKKDLQSSKRFRGCGRNRQSVHQGYVAAPRCLSRI